MATPRLVQIVGDEVAISWSDGIETYFKADALRAASPSAETQGERDIFGSQYGGGGARRFVGVTVTGWEPVGNYAIRFDFSDGHRTGLYGYEYLRRLAKQGPG
ncbi:MAG: gamma-butyrobetaine hydroxylase-like domain-containing protein [Opitutaceae bacterium]